VAKKKVKTTKTAKPAQTKPSNPGLDESALTKGELRKLNALRKSIGDKLGEEAFAKWLKKQSAAKSAVTEDKNAALIAETLAKLIDEKNLRIPRGGYLVTRGRGRVIVKQPKQD